MRLSNLILSFSLFAFNVNAGIFLSIGNSVEGYPHPVMRSFSFTSPASLNIVLQQPEHWRFASQIIPYNTFTNLATPQPNNQLNNFEMNAYLLQRAQLYRLENSHFKRTLITPYTLHGHEMRWHPYIGFYSSPIITSPNSINQPERLNNSDLTNYLLERAYRFSQE
jgi:hypothetical protein